MSHNIFLHFLAYKKEAIGKNYMLQGKYKKTYFQKKRKHGLDYNLKLTIGYSFPVDTQ
jgi:hypothetical protein